MVGAGEGLRFRPTDQQLLAGWHLCAGRIVELAAGEGKTVAAAFPTALYGLLGRTTHVVTANDYLAARDCERLAPVYRALGLTVGAVLDHMAGPERRESYANRIIYSTLREFAFDYLRDRLAMSADEQIQGPLDAAIIDEADQTLLDEAVTPLIIAGTPVVSRRNIVRANRAVRQLVVDKQARLAAECRRQLQQSAEDGQADDKSAMLLALGVAGPAGRRSDASAGCCSTPPSPAGAVPVGYGTGPGDPTRRLRKACTAQCIRRGAALGCCLRE